MDVARKATRYHRLGKRPKSLTRANTPITKLESKPSGLEAGKTEPKTHATEASIVPDRLGTLSLLGALDEPRKLRLTLFMF
jgi:hypothetical protein